VPKAELPEWQRLGKTEGRRLGGEVQFECDIHQNRAASVSDEGLAHQAHRARRPSPSKRNATT
jgi:hypothetical protein